MKATFTTPQLPGRSFEARSPRPPTRSARKAAACWWSWTRPTPTARCFRAPMPMCISNCAADPSATCAWPPARSSVDEHGVRVATVDADNRVKFKSVVIAKDFGAEVAIASGLDAGGSNHRQSARNPRGWATGAYRRAKRSERQRMKRAFRRSCAVLAPPCRDSRGCDFAPAYAPPDVATPRAVQDGAAAGPRAAGAKDWWRDFHSAELDRLETRIETDNPDYAAALARYQRAKAMLDLAQLGALSDRSSVSRSSASTSSRRTGRCARQTSRPITAPISCSDN